MLQLVSACLVSGRPALFYLLSILLLVLSVTSGHLVAHGASHPVGTTCPINTGMGTACFVLQFQQNGVSEGVQWVCCGGDFFRERALGLR